MDTNTLLLILANIIVIIGLARLIGLLFARFQQPPVIGEIIAGIMLRPSLLGLLSPALEKVFSLPLPSHFCIYSRKLA
ncbi:hypothetical protein NON20_04015 [Synechocystis sp. B12]|nr:hypothetical protein NON20_04015 [Synechocystis sp. B12]